ncbi:hypothetical protein HGRIS_012226 [Hohenbuehelia grisea]|uniref:MICOS complex subunit MIC12 n=1 Tax=Hohenbuehelia grisea TaxID=104357 RepID=A0ABR3IRM3_9AGAR
MSVFVGPISGALVAGGVYYGISNLISTRTEQQRRDLRVLSARLVETPTLVNAPPSAASRIDQQPFASMLKAKWNEEIHTIFVGFGSWQDRAQQYTQRLLYGPSEDSRPSDTVKAS